MVRLKNIRLKQLLKDLKKITNKKRYFRFGESENTELSRQLAEITNDSSKPVGKKSPNYKKLAGIVAGTGLAVGAGIAAQQAYKNNYKGFKNNIDTLNPFKVDEAKKLSEQQQREQDMQKIKEFGDLHAVIAEGDRAAGKFLARDPEKARRIAEKAMAEKIRIQRIKDQDEKLKLIKEQKKEEAKMAAEEARKQLQQQKMIEQQEKSRKERENQEKRLAAIAAANIAREKLQMKKMGVASPETPMTPSAPPLPADYYNFGRIKRLMKKKF